MKNKIAVSIALFCLVWQIGVSQNVGINSTGTTPRNCAMLDIVSSSTGLLIPNLALTNVTTYAPATGTAVDGLLVYSTSAPIGGGGTGYYYWSTSAAKWINLVDVLSPGGPWLLNGNASITTPASPATYGTSTIGAAENFLGTTDANDVVFGTNNIERMRIKLTTGNVGIGVAAPATKLHISRGDIGIGRIDGGDDTPYARFGLSNGWEQYLANNAFYNSSTSQWNYVNTGGYGGLASMMYQVSGVLSFYNASNAANPVAWTQRMTILNNGNIGINNSSPSYLVHTLGSSGTYVERVENSTGTGTAIQGINTAATANTLGGAGVYGVTAQAQGYGVYGYNSNPNSVATYPFNTGVYGKTANGLGDGVLGEVPSIAGANWASGVSGIVDGSGNYAAVWGAVNTAAALTLDVGVLGTTLFSAGLPNLISPGVPCGVNGSAGATNCDIGVYCYSQANTTCGWSLYSNGWAGGNHAWVNTSDKLLKQDIKPINASGTSSLQKVLQLSGYTYKFKKELNWGDNEEIGFLSQDVEKVFPQLVIEKPFQHPVQSSKGGKNIDIVEKGTELPSTVKYLNYTGLIPVLVEAMKEQQQQIEDLKKELTELKKGK